MLLQIHFFMQVFFFILKNKSKKILNVYLKCQHKHTSVFHFIVYCLNKSRQNTIYNVYVSIPFWTQPIFLSNIFMHISCQSNFQSHAKNVKNKRCKNGLKRWHSMTVPVRVRTHTKVIKCGASSWGRYVMQFLSTSICWLVALSLRRQWRVHTSSSDCHLAVHRSAAPTNTNRTSMT